MSNVMPQWCILEDPRQVAILSRELGISLQEARKKIGKVILLSIDAQPVYLAVGEAYARQYKKRPKDDYGSTPEQKAKGVAGNDAMHATLNQCGIFYQTDQLFASFDSDRIWHDFILAPSRTKIEIKTSNSRFLNLNRKHLQSPTAPNVVIALRHTITENLIVLEFAGWLRANEVNSKNFTLIETSDFKKSYFRCETERLNAPINLREFLKGLAKDGIDYLDQFAV